MTGFRGSVEFRLKSKIRICWNPIERDFCWIFTGYTLRGYGQIRGADGRTRLAHIVSYEIHVGPVPDGLTLDHTCRNRSCVNPAHLDPVTQAENLRRGDKANNRLTARSHCKNGHEYNHNNTLFGGSQGGRRCRVCNRERERRRRGKFST